MKIKAALIITMTIFSISWVFGQNPNNEKLNAYKIAFFSKRMNLTSDEAEKFWPVYNDFQVQKRSIQQEKVLLNKIFSLTGNTMSEKELIEMGDKMISLEVREAALSKQFHNNFKEVLPPIKVLWLYQAENQYKLQLLNELQDRRKGRNSMMYH